MLLLECDDSQALDLLSLPTSIKVRLRRRIVYDAQPGQARKARKWKDALEDLASGAWRPRSGNQEQHQRLVEGEIPLAGDLQPSSAIATLLVNVVVFFFFSKRG
jgi:shikimate kinase